MKTEIATCRVCEKKYKRFLKNKRKGRNGAIARQSNCVTCSKECSIIWRDMSYKRRNTLFLSKEVERKDAVIKISTILEVTEKPRGTVTNNPVAICVEVDKPTVKHSSCFRTSKRGKMEAIRFIKNSLFW